MIDAHIHILPSIDDGAANEQLSMEMAAIAVDDGIHSVICTPHHLNLAFDNPRNEVLKAVQEFQSMLEDNQLALTAYPGSELHVGPDLVSLVLNEEAMTLADKKKHVLIEYPKHFLPHGAETVLETLLYNNITPIIAHPERNSELFSKTELLSEWVDWGCAVQLTAMSITGQFGKPLQARCKSWCQQGLAHIVASDAHRTTGRVPKLAQARQVLTEWLDEESATVLTRINPQKIIDGQVFGKIEPVAVAEQKHNNSRKFFSLFGR